DVRIEELNATFTFKMEGSDEYHVASVSHDDFTEMYEVDYNLEEGTLEDNEQLSLFGKEDQEFVSNSLNRLFPAVEKKIHDNVLIHQSEENIAAIRILRFLQAETRQEVVRVYQ